MKNIIIALIIVMIFTSCSKDNTKETKLEYNENMPVVESEVNLKSYYGKWKVNRLLSTDVPSVLGQEDVDPLMGATLILTDTSATFDNIELVNPSYEERIISSSDIIFEFALTYESLGMDSTAPPIFVTIYKGADFTFENKWIQDSMIYRFFVKDDDTLIAENRNTYFELIRLVE